MISGVILIKKIIFEDFELRLDVFFLRGIPDFEMDFFELLEIGMISMASF